MIVQVCRTGAGAEVYHEFTLYNAIIAGRALANVADSNNTGIEYLTLAFTRLDEKFIPYDSANQVLGTPVIVGFDLKEAKVF